MKHEYSEEEKARIAAYPFLTDREREAFDLAVRRGWAIEDAAAEMWVSRSTVKRALASMRRKCLY